MDFYVQPQKVVRPHKIPATRGLRVFKTSNSAPTDPWFVGSKFEKFWNNVKVGDILEVEMVGDNKPDYGGTVIYLNTTDRYHDVILIPPSFFTTANFLEVDAAEGPLFLSPDTSKVRA